MKKIKNIRVEINEIGNRKIEKNQQNQKMVLWKVQQNLPLTRLIIRRRRDRRVRRFTLQKAEGALLATLYEFKGL